VEGSRLSFPPERGEGERKQETTTPMIMKIEICDVVQRGGKKRAPPKTSTPLCREKRVHLSRPFTKKEGEKGERGRGRGSSLLVLVEKKKKKNRRW